VIAKTCDLNHKLCFVFTLCTRGGPLISLSLQQISLSRFGTFNLANLARRIRSIGRSKRPCSASEILSPIPISKTSIPCMIASEKLTGFKSLHPLYRPPNNQFRRRPCFTADPHPTRDPFPSGPDLNEGISGGP